MGAAGALGSSERGRLFWHGGWQHPKNQPALPQLPAPPVTLGLASLSISPAVRTLGAPPCLYPLEGQGVGPPKAGCPRATRTLEK